MDYIFNCLASLLHLLRCNHLVIEAYNSRDYALYMLKDKLMNNTGYPDKPAQRRLAYHVYLISERIKNNRIQVDR